MKQLDAESTALVARILAGASDLTLATLRADGSPHASTVNFVHQGLNLYAAISIDSGKAHDIGHDSRVALTVNLPYINWSAIQGLAIDGRAAFVADRQELITVGALLRKKQPAFEKMIADPDVLPWPGMLFLRITPRALALLDYTKGYGHTSYFDLGADTGS